MKEKIKTSQNILRKKFLKAGVNIIAPETVFFSSDTKIGKNVVINPYVVIGPKVKIGNNVEILPFTHIESAELKNKVSVGPFSRIRPGSILKEGSRVGNFVELKKTTLGTGAKANHLSYVGDAVVGNNSNIGAGTITCNYDGVNKHQTTIEPEVFVGSGTELVAPVTIGHGAYIGAGSCITENVPANALALARGRQVIKEARATKIRKHSE